MEYVVYLTINMKTDRFYVGIHEAGDENYLGWGCWADQASSFKYPKNPLQVAMKKYGADAFRRIDLFISNTKEKAVEYYNRIVTHDFILQANTYNMYTYEEDRKIYCFNKYGKLVKIWNNKSDIMDFYGITKVKIDDAIWNRYLYLDCVWSYDNKFKGYNADWKWREPTFIFSDEGKMLYEFCDRSLCAKAFKTDVETIQTLILQNRKLDGRYYVSNKMTDLFVPKARRAYYKTLFYAYKEDKYLGQFRGKDIMKVIGMHSWKKIKAVMELYGGHYKDFILSEKALQPITENKSCLDVYDHFGNYIESFESIEDARIKYKIPAHKLKNIQLGDKYFEDHIFKYHSKNNK